MFVHILCNNHQLHQEPDFLYSMPNWTRKPNENKFRSNHVKVSNINSFNFLAFHQVNVIDRFPDSVNSDRNKSLIQFAERIIGHLQIVISNLNKVFSVPVFILIIGQMLSLTCQLYILIYGFLVPSVAFLKSIRTQLLYTAVVGTFELLVTLYSVDLPSRQVSQRTHFLHVYSFL